MQLAKPKKTTRPPLPDASTLRCLKCKKQSNKRTDFVFAYSPTTEAWTTMCAGCYFPKK